MPRKYYRKRYVNKDKYSIETRIYQTDQTEDWALVDSSSTLGTQDSHQRVYEVVSPTNVQGVRKVKHFTLTFTSNSTGELKPLAYALVYVPEGYGFNNIRIPTEGNLAPVNMYEPNQFVISQGVLDFSGGPLRIRSPLSRNLNSGDRIMIVLSAGVEWGWDTSQYTGTISYAISYQ